MNDEKHISAVCKELDTTSRTIRYYEQLGLLRTVRSSRTAPRRLDRENTERLRKILFLRKLGLSLDEILEIFRDDLDVAELLRNKSTDLKAEIAALRSRIRLLEKVTKAAENGDDIYAVQPEAGIAAEDVEHCRIAAQCTALLLEQRFTEIQPFVIEKIRQYFLPDLISISWKDFIKPCGAFKGTGSQTVEGNMVKNLLHFEKTGAVVTFSFCDEGINGILIEYMKEKEHSHV